MSAAGELLTLKRRARNLYLELRDNYPHLDSAGTSMASYISPEFGSKIESLRAVFKAMRAIDPHCPECPV